ncbi:MAG: hypothetical protein GFH27_549349n64 [Chloroflexi bacterium AL-W]|nr:hypothetical protein [Chloroflexi bacterium AL-W]
MNTPSHLIINAALRKGFRRKVNIPRSAFLWGAVAPDLPLYLLSIGGFVYYRYVQGMETRDTFNYMFDTLFFKDPFWIATHNFFHSPTILLLMMVVLWRFRGTLGSPLRWIFWFAVGCLIHTAIDIPTHVNDGPLLFFPFEWTIRYTAPISYWDGQYYGTQFAVFEMALNILLLGYLFGPGMWRWLKSRLNHTTSAEVEIQ